MSFPKKFVWGAATASYQVEGAAFEDGRGPSIWDVFSADEGKVAHHENGDIACDHYHRYKEDVQIMKKLGLKAYRFSISWSRILPNGVGEVNEKGVEFYNRLIDELVANDIEPYITLFHWDLPYALHLKGAWMNQESSDWFAEYAQLVAERFSDRVANFFTFNEPQCFIGASCMGGVHAPGTKSTLRDGLHMAHNVLKAHGKAVKALRQYAKQEICVSIVTTALFHYPETNSVQDIDATRLTTMSMPENPKDFASSVTWWLDPIFFGKYPEEFAKQYEKDMPVIEPGDMELISQPLDFLGQNMYSGSMVRMGKDKTPEFCDYQRGCPISALKWCVTPETLYWGPKFLHERYGKGIFITENGLSCHDWMSLDGKVHDPNRIDFLQRYLRAFSRASDDGVDIVGYFAWSLMDNFEWHSGYDERFGLVYVDYQTLERTIKDSGYWYKTIIESNGDLL